MMKKSMLTLFSFVLLLSPVSSAFANSSNSQEITDKKAFEATLNTDYMQVDIKGEIFETYQYKQSDGTIRMEAHSPNGDVEIFSYEENVLYDENGEVLAIFNEVFVPHDVKSAKNTNIELYAYSYGTTAPLPAHEYTIFKGTTYGDVVLKKNITTFTQGALAILLGVFTPSLGTVLSAYLLYEAIEFNKDAYAIYYKKNEWHHKNFKNLEKQIFITMYWDPEYKSQAGKTEVEYASYF